MTKVTLDADTIPVVVEITAGPGDVLLVVDGVCIGVQHQRFGGHGGARAGAGRPKKAAKRIGRAANTAENEKLLAVLRKSQPMDTSHWLDAVGLDPKDHERGLAGLRIYRMKKAGLIKRARGDANKAQPRWVVA